MQTLNVALVGATGNVGQALMELWSQKATTRPLSLLLVASEQSAGKTLRVEGKSLQVQDVSEFDWSQAHIALFCAGAAVAKQCAQTAAEQGCVVIDNSGFFANDPSVPLWVPGVNDEVIDDYRQSNIIALADSLVSQLALVLQPLRQHSDIVRLNVTHLLAASVSGQVAVEELAGQTAQLLNGLPIEPHHFARQLAFNLLPLVADEQQSVPQERQFIDQLRRVFMDEGIPVSSQFIQAAVFYGNTQWVQVELTQSMSIDEIEQVLANYTLINLLVPPAFPSPVVSEPDPYRLQVGGVQFSYGIHDLLQFCSVADNIHFSGALLMDKAYQQLLGHY